MSRKLILASTSKYRAESLRRLGLAFEAQAPECDESPQPGESPRDLARRLSLAKARSLQSAFPHALIIGSDQVADLDGEAISKPGTREAARRQLESLSGRSLVFHSGLALLDAVTGEHEDTVIDTRVTFRPLDSATIENYLDRENALDCAGSAKSEGLGVALIQRVESTDHTALIGLPLIALVDMLGRRNVRALG